ncbi:hypothetical protein GCM10023168_28210 [Fodinibacter luteus]|uniref:Thioredoxin-like fold domain-containing protein n=1 Tax=Fodinibacter luteus TaxID=552064 RepID=A0ABP8KKK2_9MICO
MSTHPGPPHGPIKVTVVESPSCHYCADAHQALEQLTGDGHPLEVTTLDVRDPAGQDLMRRHGAGMSPLVLVDGAFFSQGRLPRRKLARHLRKCAERPHITTGA